MGERWTIEWSMTARSYVALGRPGVMVVSAIHHFQLPNPHRVHRSKMNASFKDKGNSYIPYVNRATYEKHRNHAIANKYHVLPKCTVALARIMMVRPGKVKEYPEIRADKE